MRRNWAERREALLVEARAATAPRLAKPVLVVETVEIAMEVAEVGTAWVAVDERVYSVQFPGWFTEVFACGHADFGYFHISKPDHGRFDNGLRLCRQCSSAGEKRG